ncbi:MAG: hypothetical protein M3P41_08320 [Actinomycetota bacterium]|nr:hypothetical protein [Actinomycetota bacterium]
MEGRVFHRGAVQALAPEDSQLTARLSSLVRKELVRPDKSELAGEDAFRFRHLLIRDAAYDGLPKAARAELHERFADWLAEHGRDLVELDEILGYHLEQACRFRAELGVADDGSLAVAALRRLEAAGRRALLRDDVPAAVNLLQRALALVPSDRFETILEVDLLEAVFVSGRVGDAYSLAAGSVARAVATGDRAGELCARIELASLRGYVEPKGAAEQLAAIVDEALPVFEASGYDFGLYVCYFGLFQVAHMRGRMDSARDALERALVHAERVGLPHLVVRLAPAAGAARLFGSTPATELLAWLDEEDRRGTSAPGWEMHRAQALAMVGRSAEARSLLSDSRAQLADRGSMIPLALATGHTSVEVELLAGDPAAAVELGVEGCRLLEQAGEQGWLSTAVGYLAEALYQLDRLNEADEAAGRAAELGASDDAITQMLWRQVRAKVLARRGDALESERLAREAVAIGAETDLLDGRGDTHADLAEVLILAGRDDEAQAALQEALTLFELKGNVVTAERMNARLRGLRRADWLD